MSVLNQSSDGEFLLNEGSIISPTHLSQQRAVIEISTQALLGSNLDELIQHTLELILGNLKMKYGEVLRYYPHSEKLQPQAGIGWKVDYSAQPAREITKNSFAQFVCEENEVVVITDFRSDDRFHTPYFLEDHQLISGLATVIRGKEENFGILGVYSDAARTFNTLEIYFVKKISTILALIVDRQRVESSLLTSRGELEAILNGIQEGISIQGGDGSLVFANDIALSMLGFTDRGDLLNTPLTTLRQRYAVFDEDGKPLPPEKLPAHYVLNGAEFASTVLRFHLYETQQDSWFIVTSSAVRNVFSEQLFAVNIFKDITALKQRENDQVLLAKASEMFASSADYKTVLKNIGNILVENIADWCLVYLVDENGKLDQISVDHRDPTRLNLLKELGKKYPPDPEYQRGVYKVMQRGKIEVFPQVSEGDLRMVSQSEDHYRLLKQLEMRSVLIVPLTARGQTLGAISLVWSKEGNTYGEREINLATNLTHLAGLAIDNARLYQNALQLNEKLETNVQRRTAQLERTNQKLQKYIDERVLIEAELQRSKALFSDLFELSPDAIFLVNREGRIVRFNAQAATIFEYSQSELENSQIETLLPDHLSSQHTVLRSVYQDKPQQRPMAAGQDLSGRRKCGKLFPVDVMLSPVKIEDEWLIICVVRDITDQKLAQNELAEVQHRLLDSLEAERLMLAQELHDGTIQELFSINFQLADVAADVEQYGNDELAQKIQDASAMTQSVIDGLRTISSGLRPPALTPFGLEQAIYSHMERFQGLHPQIEVNLELHPDGQLLEERIRLVLFRIYQNAVSNVARHAEAHHIWVKFNLDDHSACLEIRDDGKGFQLPARWVELARQGHLGLVGTSERVEAIGGELTIDSKPGEGTSIFVRVPQNLSS